MRFKTSRICFSADRKVVGCLGSRVIRASSTVCNSLLEHRLFSMLLKQVAMKVGSAGVVISLMRLGYSQVSMKMRTRVMTVRDRVVGGSGFLRNPRRVLTQGLVLLRTSRPPASMVALIKTTADHLPSMVRSWRRLASCVLNRWTVTPSSEFCLLVGAVEERRSLHCHNEADTCAATRGS